jgi:hypothetical protein
MYIYAFSNIVERVETSLCDKKSRLIKKFNRSDNFINLTLLGVQQCVKERSLPKQTSVYIASKNGNMNTTLKVFDSIFIQKKLPMPFDFLNTVNSVKLFYVAKNFELEGKTLFVDRFESALPQAFVDVENGKPVLLGIITEAIADLKLYREKFRVGEMEEEIEEEIEESSRWLLLSPQIEGRKEIAKINKFKLHHSIKAKNSEKELFSFLEGDDTMLKFRGEGLSFELQKNY